MWSSHFMFKMFTVGQYTSLQRSHITDINQFLRQVRVAVHLSTRESLLFGFGCSVWYTPACRLSVRSSRLCTPSKRINIFSNFLSPNVTDNAVDWDRLKWGLKWWFRCSSTSASPVWWVPRWATAPCCWKMKPFRSNCHRCCMLHRVQMPFTTDAHSGRHHDMRVKLLRFNHQAPSGSTRWD